MNARTRAGRWPPWPIKTAWMSSASPGLRSSSTAEETGKTVPQIAINWLLQRPTVASVIIGARNEAQLRNNLGAAGWALAPEHIAKLDAASATTAPYPYFPYQRQEGFAKLNPPAV